jgi:hypothetical protein
MLRNLLCTPQDSIACRQSMVFLGCVNHGDEKKQSLLKKSLMRATKKGLGHSCCFYFRSGQARKALLMVKAAPGRTAAKRSDVVIGDYWAPTPNPR